MTRTFPLIVASMVAACAAAALAAPPVLYTDKPDWADALGGPFLTEDFADDVLNAGLSFDSSESGHINPALEVYQDVLAVQSGNEPMTVWHFASPMQAFGGNWTLGGPGGSGNSLRVYIVDLGQYVGAIPSSYNGGFWGFTADTPFTAVKLVGGLGTNQQTYTLDDLVYADVPEPACLPLLGAGALLLARRR